MKSKIGDKERLGHVLDYSEFIEKSLAGVSQDEFNKNFILHTAVQIGLVKPVIRYQRL